jgi:hypothetical protein
LSRNQGKALISAQKNTSLLRNFFGVAVGNAMVYYQYEKFALNL